MIFRIVLSFFLFGISALLYINKDQILGLTFNETINASIAIYYDLTILYFLGGNTIYIVILLLGFINSREKHLEHLTNISSYLSPLKSLKPISLLVPCYNEEGSVEASLSAMLRLNYPDFEVIVCNDGSTDSSLSILIEKFKLKEISTLPPQILPSKKINKVYYSEKFDNLIVVDKENGGKADSLNAAINFSHFPLICCVDSDSILDNQGLVNIGLPFLESDDVIATGGTILVSNTEKEDVYKKFSEIDTSVPSTWLGIIQVTEYLRAFLVGRLGWNLIKCDAIISGAFGLFKKSLVIKVGGYETKTIGEDMELLLRMQSYCLENKQKYRVNLLPTPVCWTEIPSDINSLGNQRVRWSQGLMDSLWIHKNMLFKGKYGVLGLLGLPYFLFFELIAAPLEVIGYLTSIIGLWSGALSLPVVLAFFSVTILYGCVLNLGSIIIDQFTFQKYYRVSDVLKLILGSILEHFGFRQMHLYWRLKGIYNWMKGKKEWGEIKRVGSKTS